MSRYICPGCGTRFFMETKGDAHTAFTVASGYVISPLVQDVHLDYDKIKSSAVFCGACSWQGSLFDLQETELY